MEQIGIDNFLSILSCLLTLLVGLVPFLLPITERKGALEKAALAIDVYTARKDKLLRSSPLTSLSDKEFEQEELLSRQIISETRRLLIASCTPILDRWSRSYGMMLSIFCFSSGFFILICIVIGLEAFDPKHQFAEMSFISGFMAIVSFSLLFNGIRFYRLITQSESNSVQIDRQGKYTILPLNPIEQTVYKKIYLSVPLTSALIAFVMLKFYLFLLPLIIPKSTLNNAASNIVLFSAYGAVSLAVIFGVICIFHAIWCRWKEGHGLKSSQETILCLLRTPTPCSYGSKVKSPLIKSFFMPSILLRTSGGLTIYMQKSACKVFTKTIARRLIMVNSLTM